MSPLVRPSAFALAAFVFLLAGAPVSAQPADEPGTFEDVVRAIQWDDESAGDDSFFDDGTFISDDEASPEFVISDLDVIDRAHAAYLRDADLQLTRPEQAPAEITPPNPPPSWLTAIARFLEALGPVFQVIFWLAVAAVVAGLLYFLFGEAIRLRFGGRKNPKTKTEDDVLADIRPDAAAARSLLDEADVLAREGRFAEAVHLLLFRSIEDIQARLEGGVPTSLTAREIAGLGRLPDRARRALAPIIKVVEHSYFGGQPVDAGGWQHARKSYEEFAFGEGWSA